MINRALEEKGIIIYYPTLVPMKEEGVPNITLLRQYSKQFILRIHVQYKTKFGLQVITPQNENINSENNIHHAIFENQLRLPPSLSQINLDFIEWYY